MISYQLYSSRRFGPLPETLRMLKDAGYGAVEGYGALVAAADPGAVRAALDEGGLPMASLHMSLDRIEGDARAAVEAARALGVRSVFVPAVPAEDRSQPAPAWEALGRRLAEAAKPFRDAGLSFGWHNHDFEFARLDGAQRPLELILEGNDIDLELDVAWVARAGEDPMAWIDRYADRITAVHVKDIAPPGENADEDGWADPGHGTLDWPALAARLSDLGVEHWVMEHDEPSDDARFARRAMETARRIEGFPA